MLTQYSQEAQGRQAKLETQHHGVIEVLINKMTNPKEGISSSGRPWKLSHTLKVLSGEVPKGEYESLGMFAKDRKGRQQASTTLIKNSEGKSELIVTIEQKVSASLTEEYDVTFREREKEVSNAIDKQEIPDNLPF